MSAESIEYYHRYRRRIETESIYGEAFLRWTYEGVGGVLALHALVKRAIFSRVYGWLMDRPNSRGRIRDFINKFGLDPSEFLERVDAYRNFNEFFYRKLKPTARPIDQSADAVVFPADGRHLGFPRVDQVDGLFVKGAVFDLRELLGDRELAARYLAGTMVMSRLCPVDYHRFHFPVGGVARQAYDVPGDLYSVNPLALRKNIRIFVLNKRRCGVLETARCGRVLLVEIGATCVGRIHHTFAPGTTVSTGAERGYFAFGGSSMITLFEPGRVVLEQDLLEQTASRRELYARMGDRMGRVC